MKNIRRLLKEDYKAGASGGPKDCVPFERLCDYANGTLPPKEKAKVESHLAGCYHCLDIVVSMHDGNKYFHNKRGLNMKKEYLYLLMALVCFLSSFIFKGYFLQFLAATIVLGMKWVVDSKTNRMLIMIYEAWRKGGEREAGRVLKEMDTKKRINF